MTLFCCSLYPPRLRWHIHKHNFGVNRKRTEKRPAIIHFKRNKEQNADKIFSPKFALVSNFDSSCIRKTFHKCRKKMLLCLQHTRFYFRNRNFYSNRKLRYNFFQDQGYYFANVERFQLPKTPPQMQLLSEIFSYNALQNNFREPRYPTIN